MKLFEVVATSKIQHAPGLKKPLGTHFKLIHFLYVLEKMVVFLGYVVDSGKNSGLITLFWGISMAIIYMVLQSSVEVGFKRFVEQIYEASLLHLYHLYQKPSKNIENWINCIN